MTSIDATLTWASPVEPDLLGAHIEAYVSLLPAIDTLRLCNRYGTGEHAVVNQLPAEIVNEIEVYMVQDQRAQQREQWATLLKCYENRCRPTDHFDMDHCATLYYGDDSETGSNGSEIAPRSYLGEDDLDVLNSMLWKHDEEIRQEESYSRYRREERRGKIGDLGPIWLYNKIKPKAFDPEQDPWYWRFVHETRVDEWEEKVGRSNALDRGFFSRWGVTIAKHFGLAVNVSHINLSKSKDALWKDEGNYKTTLAYLILAGCPQGCQELERRFSVYDPIDDYPSQLGDWERNPQYQDTENSMALPMVVPRPLSKKSLTCFIRALKMLELSPCQMKHQTMPVFCASKEDLEAAKNEREEGASEPDIPRPQLMFLLRVNDWPLDDGTNGI